MDTPDGRMVCVGDSQSYEGAAQGLHSCGGARSLSIRRFVLIDMNETKGNSPLPGFTGSLHTTPHFNKISFCVDTKPLDSARGPEFAEGSPACNR